MSKKFFDILNAVKHDFSDHADIKGVYIRVFSGREPVVRVTVRDADGTFRVWEMVDDGVSSELWREVSTEAPPPIYDENKPIPFAPVSLTSPEVCRDDA